MGRKEFPAPRPNNSTTNPVPLDLTFNKTLPNIKKIVNKHFCLLQINRNHNKISEERPIIANRRNTTLCELARCNRILNDRVVRKSNIEKKIFTESYIIPKKIISTANRSQQPTHLQVIKLVKRSKYFTS